MLKWRLIWVFASLVGASAVWGQVNTATVYGNVADPSGAAIPNAQATLKNPSTGSSQTAISNTAGEFTFTFIPVGTYDLNVAAPGFQAYSESGVTLTAGQNLRLQVQLKVGDVKNVVTVTGEQTLVNAVNAEQLSSVGSQQVKQLPVSRMDWTSLLSLDAGVELAGSSGVAMNGLPPAGYSVTVDGTNSSGSPEFTSLGMYQNFNTIKVVSPDAIQEVSVTKGIAPAEVSGTMSGNVNIITKSGTNEFHGDAFLNNQVAAYNARNPLLKTKTGDTFNQFGGSAGGPIVKDKLFFFTSYEGLQERAFTNVSGDAPTPLFLQEAAAANPAYTANFSYYPLPNQPYSSTALTGQYIAPGSTSSSDNYGTVRGDYYITPVDTLTMRYTHSEPGVTKPRIIAQNSRTYTSSVNGGTLTYTHSWGASVAVTRFGYDRSDIARVDGLHNVPGANDLVVVGLDNSGGEAFIMGGPSMSLEQTMAINRGRHTIKFGVSFVRNADSRDDVDLPALQYPSFDAFLAGDPSQVTLNFGVRPYDLYFYELGGFIQDDFKFSRRLTINLGLRYDYFTVPKERDGRLFNRAQPFGFGPLLPPSQIYNPDTNNFGPRIGFAYSLDNQQTTVVRGGFGIFYSPHNLYGGPLELIADNINLPNRVILTGPQAAQLGILYPIIQEQTAQAVENGLSLPAAGTALDTNFPTPFSMQWTLTLERQIKGILFSAGYVGTRGVHLNMVRYMNEPDRLTDYQVPGFATFRYYDTANSSNYNALQITAKKRFSTGLSFNINYAWARNMGWGTSDLLLEGAPQDNDLHAGGEYGRTPYDLRHSFIASVLYELPFARWAGNGHFVKETVGGWQISSVITAQTGLPLNITENSNYSDSRPDYIGGNAVLSNYDNTRLYLNPAAFQLVPLLNGNPIQPGNIGRDAVPGPGLWTVDLSLAKNFTITERSRFQIRADAFNSLNHPNPSNIVTNLSQGSFGTINTLGFRTLQLGARISF
jgi:Carboxypeptidase regulatory-like domain